MGEEGSWDTTVDEWLLAEGYCVAGGLASIEDGAFYAAAPVDGEKGWGLIYKEGYSADQEQDDGSTVSIAINEQECMQAVLRDERPKNGLWIGGVKYTITNLSKPEEIGEFTSKITIGKAPKKGCVIATTQTQVVLGLFDETVNSQNGGNCLKTVCAFAQYLVESGY